MKVPSQLSTAAPDDFSLVLGGPLYQFFLRAGPVKPPLDRVGWRMFFISMTAWAPLLVLTILDGRFLSGVKIPFLHDLEVHIKLLVAIPLAIAAEVTIHRRMKAVVSQFLERQIITPATRVRFGETIESAMRLRNSSLIELGSLALVWLGGGLFGLRLFSGLKSDTWYATLAAGGMATTPRVSGTDS